MAGGFCIQRYAGSASNDLSEADETQEFGEFWDAGTTFYATDFWSFWDLGIIATGVAFFITRMVGIVDGNQRTTDTAFDILAVEALFLVPRSVAAIK